jgi:hypothetical protein
LGQWRLSRSSIERRLNVDGLNCYLSLNNMPAPFTMIADIFKPMPGHMLKWRFTPISSPSHRVHPEFAH